MARISAVPPPFDIELEDQDHTGYLIVAAEMQITPLAKKIAGDFTAQLFVDRIYYGAQKWINMGNTFRATFPLPWLEPATPGTTVSIQVMSGLYIASIMYDLQIAHIQNKK